MSAHSGRQGRPLFLKTPSQVMEWEHCARILSLISRGKDCFGGERIEYNEAIAFVAPLQENVFS
jgi:hypothetical protein